MLFERTIKDRAGFADERARPFDAFTRFDQNGAAQLTGRRSDQTGPEVNGGVGHRASYGSGTGASPKKSAMSEASRSLSARGGSPKISSSVFTTLATLRCPWPT